jgi:hypothetical protein
LSTKRLPYPAYLPDQLPRDVLTAAINVFPAADGYRPVRGFSNISDPLPATFKGGFAAISTDGTTYLLGGTANGLARYSGGGWTDLLVGLSITDRWRFVQFGDFVVAVNGVSTKQIDLNAGSASDIPNCPSGNGVAVVGDYVVITQAQNNKLLVQWSGFNDHTKWISGTDQAGFQPMLTGGEIKGIAGGEYGVILQRFRLVRMERTGDATAPFSFSEITPNFGCASSGSIAQAGRSVFFLSDRGFMSLEDGQSLKPLGNEKFDQAFRDSVSPEDYEKMWSAIDPKRSLVFWGVPGTPGRIWVYNWVLDRASTIEIPFLGLFAGYESSQSLEDVAALYPNLDTMPYSLDDPRFQGGDPRLYLVDRLSRIGALAGPNLQAVITMGWQALADPLVARVRSLTPMSDATTGVTISIDQRQRMGDRIGLVVSGTMQASGRVPVRARGKYLAITTTIAEGVRWSYAQGLDCDYSTGGGR